MEKANLISRRTAVKSSIFGILAVSIPKILFSKEIVDIPADNERINDLFYKYPAIDDQIVSEVVGNSHFNLDRVKELVDKRPELARATWDWGFGDWETAIGAASHVGRRDIVEYLMKKGARPDIFTFAALGDFNSVKTITESFPGIQSTSGPHGISLLQHAKNGLRSDNLVREDKEEANKLVVYLESLAGADGENNYIDVKEVDKQKYLGDYKYGDGPKDGFSIRLNMRKLLSLGKIGTFGGALYKIGENEFTYNGAPSVKITFMEQNGHILGMTIHEPGLTLTAKKI